MSKIYYMTFDGSNPINSNNVAFTTGNDGLQTSSNYWILNNDVAYNPNAFFDFQARKNATEGVVTDAGFGLIFEYKAPNGPVHYSLMANNGWVFYNMYLSETTDWKKLFLYVPNYFLSFGDDNPWNQLKLSLNQGSNQMYVKSIGLMDFSIQAQEETQWCWAAVTASMDVYYETGEPIQCRSSGIWYPATPMFVPTKADTTNLTVWAIPCGNKEFFGIRPLHRLPSMK